MGAVAVDGTDSLTHLPEPHETPALVTSLSAHVLGTGRRFVPGSSVIVDAGNCLVSLL